jgi:hypothetical protein
LGGSACVVIINGNKAYAYVEELAERYNQVNAYQLEAALNASCAVVPYASLYLEANDGYLGNEFTQPIIDLHRRIINELPFVEKDKAQALVNELAKALFEASEAVILATETS